MHAAETDVVAMLSTKIQHGAKINNGDISNSVGRRKNIIFVGRIIIRIILFMIPGPIFTKPILSIISVVIFTFVIKLIIVILLKEDSVYVKNLCILSTFTWLMNM